MPPEDPPAESTAALIAAALGPTDVGTSPTSAHPSSQLAPAQDVLALIDIYFQMESPVERDAVFDELVALRSPLVEQFLEQMLLHDADEHLRVAAALELGRRGKHAGADLLRRASAQTEDRELMRQALSARAELEGRALFEELVQRWQAVEGDRDLAEAILACLEQLDAARTLALLAQFMAALEPAQIEDEILELCVLAFARHEYREGAAALANLERRVAAARDLDPEQRRETLGLLREGYALLNADPSAGDAPND